MKALIVDDERHVREAISLLVNWSAFGIDTVLEADNGQAGIALIQAERPALVFTDMMMPVLGGDKLMAWAAEHAPESKVIVVSGHDNFELVRTAVQYGGMDYILKPIDPVQLNAAVERALESWRAEEGHRSRSRGIDMELNRLKPVYAEQQFGALLKGTGSAQEFAASLRGRDASAPLAAIRIAVLELDSAPPLLAAKFGADGSDLLAFAVANIAGELLGEHRCGQAFRHNVGAHQEIVLLFWDRLDDACSLLVEFNDALHAAFKARFAFGVGQQVQFPQGLAASYRQARTALLQRNLLRQGKHIHIFDPAAGGDTGPALFFSAYEERVRLAVQSGADDGIRKALQPWFQALDARAKLTPEQLLLWRQEFRLASSIWEGSAQVADTTIPYPEQDEETIPVDADGGFDYGAWKETFVREACETAKRLQAGSEKGSTIRDIAAHIEQFAHEDLTLQSISERFHLSREYISRKFKQELNQNVSDYITTCRINRAKMLLASPHLKITQIAEMAGFQDEKYFSKVFKKWTDQTPSEYRKRLYDVDQA
ncbi:helix-turn-helix domain-containing protein [Paenibacillus sacheonensis]|uniref:Response regulator n=1 Tax=Paenibacillus sacheonensis TaxID=742054 RepID=A0A7X5BXK3_9BACL|nr:helix-turn-helix domain-containing protein [Paenibacillus sacheonensis]MBM7566000.1 two-component system response regulator YesN [Paenibacillus sacheonensis]NBC68687.1 response regulator [Paenibacillus sacheonensis]